MTEESKRYAVVEGGKVINVVIWDGKPGWTPDAGEAVACPNDVGIGWSYSPKKKDKWAPPAK